MDNSRWTAKKIVFVILLSFGVIQLCTTIAVYIFAQNKYIDDEAFFDEYWAYIMAQSLDDKLTEGSSDPYRFVNKLYSKSDKREKLYCLVVDSAGVIIAPDTVAGKSMLLQFDDDDDYKEDHYNGYDYDAYKVPVGDTGLFLVTFYNWDYIYEVIRVILDYIIIGAVVIGIIVLLLVWFVILPRIERVMRRKQAVEREFHTAHDLQQKAVPQSFPDDSRFEMSALLRPTKEIGGDLYDYVLQGDYLYFMVGDVSDKGLSAALVTFLMGGQFHSMIVTRDDISVKDLMSALNNSLFRNKQFDMFCTMFIGKINLKTLQMEYCNAGHEKMVIINNQQSTVNGQQQKCVELLDANPNLVLGVFGDYDYVVETMQLEKGMTIVEYTDGVTEARNDKRIGNKPMFFGEERLLRWAKGLTGAESADEMTHSLLKATEQFRGNVRQHDDIAIMTIKLIKN